LIVLFSLLGNRKMQVYSNRLDIPEAEYGSPMAQGGCAKPKVAVRTDCGTKYSKKVLVIDDEVSILNEFVDFLQKRGGYEITSCLTAEDALETAKNDDFDLIISDINLGTANGLELCQQIHEIEQSHDTPVIFLSGAQIPDIIRRSHSAGGTYYVRKPFDPEVMLELIDKAMWFPALVNNHLRHAPKQEMARV